MKRKGAIPPANEFAGILALYINELPAMVEDAKRCWFETAVECRYDIPMPKNYTEPDTLTED